MSMVEGTPVVGQTVTSYGQAWIYSAVGTWDRVPPPPDPSILRVQNVAGGQNVLVMQAGVEPTQAPPVGSLYVTVVGSSMLMKDPSGAVGAVP